MKRGFTLIELMAVIVLLGLIGLIVFPSILNQLKKIDTSISEANKKLIYSAVDDYIDDNIEDYRATFDNDGEIVVNLNTLIDEGYLGKNIDIKDYNYIKVAIKNKISTDYELLKLDDKE